jgi:hypothetical protein
MSSSGYRQIIYSGTCLCGHAWDGHHLGVVMAPEAAAVMGPYLPQECEHFGFDETGGLDASGDLHCQRFVDAADPDDVRRAEWRERLDRDRQDWNRRRCF